MTNYTLQELVSSRGLTEVASHLGCTPVAVFKAIQKKRRITVVANDDGTYEAEERRPFPSQSSARKA